jgi:hypothetical protein
VLSDHEARTAIEEALIEALGERLHHYALTTRKSSAATFGPPHAPLHHVARTTNALTEIQARAFAALPHVEHPTWRQKVRRQAVTRVIFRTHGDLLVAVAVNGAIKPSAVADFARDLEAAVKKKLRTLIHTPSLSLGTRSFAPERAT